MPKVELNEKQIENVEALKKKINPWVELPKKGRTLAKFAKEIALIMRESDRIFYNPDLQKIVEIDSHFDAQARQEKYIFSNIEPKRMLNLLEEEIVFFVWSEEKVVKEIPSGGYQIETVPMRKEKTPSEQLVKIVMSNSDFINSLYVVKRFLTSPLVFDKGGKLHIAKKGYNEFIQGFLISDINIEKQITVSKAIDTLNECLSGFCFRENDDKIIAFAYLLTPFCRGLYNSINTRTPVFTILANRERAGKDYLAGVRNIIYVGKNIVDSPIVTGSRESNKEEELRKKFTSILQEGRRLFHSGNNKGNLNSAVFESFITSSEWSDRILGSNTTATLSNEIDISLSANSGLTYTPDFWFRNRPIWLFYSEEDPNSRTFKHQDLHSYVLKNRDKIFQSLLAIVRAWYDGGKPSSAVFSSFPEWARVVGGIMEFHNLGNPCMQREDDHIGGDKITQDMKVLFEEMYKLQHPNEQELLEGWSKKKIMDEIQSKQEEWDVFEKYDFQGNDRVSFGKLFRKFEGRTLSNITLKVDDKTKRADKMLYTFNKEGGWEDKDGSLQVSKYFTRDKKHSTIYKTHLNPLPSLDDKDSILKKVKNYLKNLNEPIHQNEIAKHFNVSSDDLQPIIVKLLSKGYIQQPKPDYVQVLK